MHPWQAIILGLVEGFTEYLPVSSTGHLILAQRMMGMENSEASDAYAVCIQAGAIAAVFGLYFPRVRQMILGILGRDAAGRRLAIHVVVGFIPAMVLGLLFSHWIKARLFAPWPIVAAWFVGGAAILAVAWWRRHRAPGTPDEGGTLDTLTWRGALLVGMLQCVAMWPGTSRSLVTIVGGLLAGLGMTAALEFSFLLGLVTLSAATVHDTYKSGHVMITQIGGVNLAVGFLVAALAAVVSVKWMVGYLKKHGLAMFGYYRVILAAVVAGMILAGRFHT